MAVSEQPDVPDESWPGIRARRLARHSLDVPAAAGRIPAIAGAICGAHAQVMSAAELSIGLRTAVTTRADVRRALWEDRTLVKTFGPRGTVHLLPSHELPLWTGALAAVPMPPGGLPVAARMDGAQTDAVVGAVADVLREGEPPTVDELSEAVIARLGDWAADPVVPGFDGMWPRWRQALHTAAHRGVLCFGPNRGRKVTYTSPDRWLPGFTPMDADAAQAEVLRRYLRAYGPANARHFAQWLSAPRPWANALFASLREELRPVGRGASGETGESAGTTAGTTLFELADEQADPPGAGPDGADPDGLRLLPYFDAYAVGSHPRARVYPGQAAERALTRGQAGTVQVVTIGGVVSGVWHQKRSGRKVAIKVEAFQELTRRQLTDLEAQSERVGQILEAVPSLALGAVDTGKHL
ncbi:MULTISPECIES: winged helix DNA-binding domain-containing protein [unclassified Streptomyces]|uniref:winged helix DNA-binding domain-containing protein n=1 Tax=unclassified Streptomyces TaxID=2593676 RepID=UPI00081DF4E9|nr:MULTISPECIES: winged helix DNA-binding domain-containing protein [unclassified Streptomyces]MYZ41120.1 winged helix DNA-binding domain-containing protein [Streptomyces sp. SID4917]SCG09469.1 Winged helix DNA-binding domain-containing protein [Streptomyces sp. MnatMP-M17]